MFIEHSINFCLNGEHCLAMQYSFPKSEICDLNFKVLLYFNNDCEPGPSQPNKVTQVDKLWRKINIASVLFPDLITQGSFESINSDTDKVQL